MRFVIEGKHFAATYVKKKIEVMSHFSFAEFYRVCVFFVDGYKSVLLKFVLMYML